MKRSMALSCILHATALLVLSAVPLSLDDRLSISGQREIIAIELTMTAPSPVATASIAMPVKLQPIEIEPTPEKRRVEPAETSLPLAEFELAERPITSIVKQVPKRSDPSRDLPPVTMTTVARPRRAPSVAAPPSLKNPPLQAVAGQAETKVEFLSNPPPKYPAAAVATRIEGTVLLKLHVSDLGKVERADVMKSSGSGLLDRAAMDAVLQWSGNPATRLGRPIASVEVLPIRFRL
ncbi:TonB family protein [Stieleria sp. TO1_6]|uniref:energy transducer TonB n=1 Tax=Stieleria tagensis TaxID=2956795 RepID=UPI00209B4A5F|nr:energy transducer TonB [Stieleria tagensis]MCO8121654.1 TonB family protein [Stieleria tagensis]